jgi:undecaprenyl pyrophosphate synthase
MTSRATLNICMPYSSREEMTRAVEKVVKQAADVEHPKK